MSSLIITIVSWIRVFFPLSPTRLLRGLDDEKKKLLILQKYQVLESMSLIILLGFGLWYLTSLSTKCQLSWRAVLLLAETGEKHRHVAGNRQTASHNVVSSTPRLSGTLKFITLVVIGTDCTCNCISNYHSITIRTAPFII